MTRGELLAVLGITLLGLLLRIAFPARAAVEHFDEGVYATRLWFAEGDDPAYPDRHLYAPPLVPWMARWSIDLFGTGLAGAMLPGIVFGTLTIPLVWWTARRWFGATAGCVAAVLAAGSDFHVLSSRTVLTDVPLCFWLLAAVYCAWESFRVGSLRWAVAAGVASGLAWWTKYNGWLGAAIPLAGLGAWLLAERLWVRQSGAAREKAFAVRRLACGLVIAVVACALWSPVYFGLQSHGGYAAVAANHRRYMVGFEGWWESFTRQAGSLAWLEGVFGWITVGVACGGAVWMWALPRERSTWHDWLRAAVGLALVVGGLVVVGATGVLAIVAAAGLLTLTWHSRGGDGGLTEGVCETSPARQAGPAGPAGGRRLALWLLAAWFFGLLAVTPLYRPYPRLTLPWLVAGWLAAAAALSSWQRGRGSAEPESEREAAVPTSDAQWRLVGWFAIALILAFGAVLPRTEPFPAWQNRTGFRSVARQIVEGARRHMEEAGVPQTAAVPFVVYVYAEPALVFHLTESGVVAQPAGHLDFVFTAGRGRPVPTFLVVGPHAERTPEFAERWPELSSRLVEVAEYRVAPSDVVLLDHYAPSALRASERRPVETVRLYALGRAE